MSSAAKLGDKVVAVDTHIALVPSPGGPVPTPVPTPFSGKLMEALSKTVMVDNMPVALEQSVALNTQPHVPTAGPFQTPPKNRGTVKTASNTVFVEGKGIARDGDVAATCNDPQEAPVGVVRANCSVKTQ